MNEHVVPRVWPVLAWLALVAAVWGLFSLHETTPNDPHDTAIQLGIGATYALAALVMLVGTRRWRVQGIGLFATMVGDAMFYLGLGVREWRGDFTERELDAIRACFVTGGALLVAGLTLWAWSTRFGTRDEEETT